MSEATESTRLQTAQRFLLNIGHPNVDEAIAALSPSVAYRVPGTHRLAGTFTGREAVTRHLVELVEGTLGTFDAVKWDDWLEGSLHVAALAQIHAQKEGRLFSGRVLFLVKFDSSNLIDNVEVFVEDEQSFSYFFG
jgi:ketosteroid isomerase-like protein